MFNLRQVTINSRSSYQQLSCSHHKPSSFLYQNSFSPSSSLSTPTDGSTRIRIVCEKEMVMVMSRTKIGGRPLHRNIFEFSKGFWYSSFSSFSGGKEGTGESDDKKHNLIDTEQKSILIRQAQEQESAERRKKTNKNSTEDDGSSNRENLEKDDVLKASDDKPVCLVVGAGHGIGSAVAKKFAFNGYSVVVARRDETSLKSVVKSIHDDWDILRKEEEEKIGDMVKSVPISKAAPLVASPPKVLPFVCDARDESQVKTMFREVETKVGPVEVCIHNIGSNISFPIIETTSKKFTKCWEMGCLSGFLVGREAASCMSKRSAPSSTPMTRKKRNDPTIIFTGASASMRGSANFAAFAVAKMGLRGLAQSMARELGPRGIHVCHVVIDGVVDTPWIRKNFSGVISKLPPDGLCQPNEIAEIYWHLSQQHRSVWTHEVDARPYSERF